MNDRDWAEFLARGLRASLEEQFIGERNTAATRAKVTAYVQGVLNHLYESGKIEFAPLPSIEVNMEVDTNIITVNFFDPNTKEQVTLAEWFVRHGLGKMYERRSE